MELTKRDKMKRTRLVAKVLAVVCAILGLLALTATPADFWLTPDQQGDRLFNSKQYADAAAVYEDPVRRGAALYRDAEFEESAASFARRDDAESAYNRGDALVLMGKYDDAIASFDRALQFRPDWQEAQDNRKLAVARRDWMKPPDDDAGGTGGQLEADEIVFDDRAKNSENTQEVEEETDQKLSDQELRQMWLNRVQTKPADFLRSKFAYQLAREASATETPDGEEEKP